MIEGESILVGQFFIVFHIGESVLVGDSSWCFRGYSMHSGGMRDMDGWQSRLGRGIRGSLEGNPSKLTPCMYLLRESSKGGEKPVENGEEQAD